MKKLKIGEPEIPKISEDFLQKRFAKWLDIKVPEQWCHIPNGGSRHLLEAVKLKAMGVKPGFPDCMIFVPLEYVTANHITIFNPQPHRKLYTCPGFFVELKVGKNKLSDNQIIVQKMLRCAGWMGVTVWNFEDAVKSTEDYLAGKFVP